ncbi:hypothetical protein MF6394_04670 [Pseudomonas sp. MF6394]|nr:hypothetical protein MF6394_04670 [Pseudomonas sp. MF6394]
MSRTPVGASLLAKNVNDDAGHQTPRGGLRFFASKLAPTGRWNHFFGAVLPCCTTQSTTCLFN